MSTSCCRRLVVMAGCLFLFLPLHALDLPSASPPTHPAAEQPYSQATYPQIVRISYAEGDVRVSRGKRGAAWETAVTGLPLQTGFNLVTGEGRAEIEFEDASTIYLAENSALAFDDLRTTAGVPHAEIGLLSGTVTLNMNKSIAGESFGLDTPTHRISIKDPNHIYERVTSYLDGMIITPLHGADSQANLSQTTYSVWGQKTEPSDPKSFAAWDSWVADRVAERSAAMTAVMKASGLTSPLPGLADMNGQGTFFPCQPYGTCWTPTLPGERAGVVEADLAQDAPRLSPEPPQSSTRLSPVGGPAPVVTFPRDTFFPCPPTRIHSLIAKDPLTGRQTVLSSNMTASPYDWAVCHAGTWIYRRHRYAWVAGERRHHHCPVHWVKSGRNVAFVPIHPKDVAGKPPLNREHGVFELTGKHSVQWARLDPARDLKVLNESPKEFRNLYAPRLARAANPQVQAHHLMDLATAKKDSIVREPGTRLTFDRKSQSFTLDKHGAQLIRSSAERAGVSNRLGNLQARAGSVDGHGNYSNHVSGSSSAGGGTHAGGGSSGGGGFHGGGGSSSGGGGSHGGGSSGGGGGSSGGGGGGGHR